MSAARQTCLQLNVESVLKHPQLSDMASKTKETEQDGMLDPSQAATGEPTGALHQEAWPDWIEASNVETSAPATDFQSWAIECAESVCPDHAACLACQRVLTTIVRLVAGSTTSHTISVAR